MLRALLAIALMTALGAGGVACGPKASYETEGTRQAPGADAEIEITRLESDNFKVKIDAEYLPPPQRVAQEATTYVVWVVPDEGETLKLGTLPLEGDREAEMFGTTVARTFEVVITAERSLDAESPSPSVVLRQQADL